MRKVIRLQRVSPGAALDGPEAGLTEEQVQVVRAPAGPLLVVAGPGSGKTRTVTSRVARWVADGTSPHRVLLLTFTNRAAREMMQRIEAQAGIDVRAMRGGTFHAEGRRILRDHAERLGIGSQFGILDTEDAESVMREVSRGHKPRRTARLPQPRSLVHLWSFARNTMRSVEDTLHHQWQAFVPEAPVIEDILQAYEARKRVLQVVDFDDLLTGWLTLLTDHPDCATLLRRSFDHVVVDEFQDINALQGRILDEMVSEHRSLTAVGDDGQAIYAFRGADYRNMLTFAERYPDARILRLQENFRSSPQIVDLANLTLDDHPTPYPRVLVSHQPIGPLAAVISCPNEEIEGEVVAQRVEELLHEGVPAREIAVLFRAQRDSMPVQVALTQRQVPFEVRAGLRFFEQRHVKDVLAFLRIVDNPHDALAWRRVLCLVEGVGPATADRLHGWAMETQGSVLALESPDWVLQVPSRARPTLEPLRHLLLHLAQPSVRADAALSLDALRSRFYDAWLESTIDRPGVRLAELDTLVSWAGQHGDISTFLDSLALHPGVGGEDSPGRQATEEPIVLSSVHQAKGLEFAAVFVIGLSEERFPSPYATGDTEALEEERRLFYVALTRAKRELILTRPEMTYTRRHGALLSRASPFLERILKATPSVCERWVLQM